jgi:hypothetical protein
MRSGARLQRPPACPPRCAAPRRAAPRRARRCRSAPSPRRSLRAEHFQPPSHPLHPPISRSNCRRNPRRVTRPRPRPLPRDPGCDRRQDDLLLQPDRRGAPRGAAAGGRGRRARRARAASAPRPPRRAAPRPPIGARPPRRCAAACRGAAEPAAGPQPPVHGRRPHGCARAAPPRRRARARAAGTLTPRSPAPAPRPSRPPRRQASGEGFTTIVKSGSLTIAGTPPKMEVGGACFDRRAQQARGSAPALGLSLNVAAPRGRQQNARPGCASHLACSAAPLVPWLA